MILILLDIIIIVYVRLIFINIWSFKLKDLFSEIFKVSLSNIRLDFLDHFEDLLQIIFSILECLESSDTRSLIRETYHKIGRET